MQATIERLVARDKGRNTNSSVLATTPLPSTERASHLELSPFLPRTERRDILPPISPRIVSDNDENPRKGQAHTRITEKIEPLDDGTSPTFT